jgi:hypothetical protein
LGTPYRGAVALGFADIGAIFLCHENITAMIKSTNAAISIPPAMVSMGFPFGVFSEAKRTRQW